MPVRHKILALAAALILLFAVAIGISALLAEQIKHRMAGISNYHLPIAGLLGRFDTLTDRYEVLIGRLLSEHGQTPEQMKQDETHIQGVLTDARGMVEQADRLLDQGIADDANSIEDRLTLAKVKGVLAHVIRDLKPYAVAGDAALAAHREHGFDAALSAARGLAEYDDSFQVDTGEMTRTLVKLAEGATQRTLEAQRRALGLDIALFAVTALIGIGLSVGLARRIAAAMRELLTGAEAVEGGDLSIILPAVGRDEIALLAHAFNRMVVELKARERIKDTFGKFVDPRVVARLVDASGDGTPGADTADRRVATVFFSDIKGFSGISETLTASAMVGLLNRYFTRMTEAVRARHGVVDKYIGDAVMAFWAAPFTPGDAHAAEAALAALDQQAALVEFRQELPQILGLRRNVPEFKVRIGIATGEVVLGTIGSPAVKSFTVIGDTVNLASRVEGVNKVFGTLILVTEDTWKLASGAIEGREIDRVVVAGKSEPVSLYEVMAPAGQLTPEQQRLIEHHAAGLAAYRNGEWAAAKSAFRAALEAMPEDGPAKVFLARIAHLERERPADWDGVWRFSEK